MIRVSLTAALTAIAFAATVLADDAKVLKPVDLAVETNKWNGKVIDTTLWCFYADKDEFRCIDLQGAGVRIDFRAFDGQGQSYLENQVRLLHG